MANRRDAIAACDPAKTPSPSGPRWRSCIDSAATSRESAGARPSKRTIPAIPHIEKSPCRRVPGDRRKAIRHHVDVVGLPSDLQAARGHPPARGFVGETAAYGVGEAGDAAAWKGPPGAAV